MKMSSQIAVIGVGLVLLSSGVVMPFRSGLSDLESEVAVLEQQRLDDAAVPAKVEQAYQRVSEIRSQRTDRAAQLCPDTPEAQQEVETLVLEAVLKSGLRQIRMDTGSVDRSARFPSRPLDLVVEGNAVALKKFLVALEAMPWVTRVINLSVDQGERIRRINLRIAVMLEAKS